MTRKIIIFEKNNQWMADFVGNNTVKTLFGTTVVPTAWTSNTPMTTVLGNIQRSNPENLVMYRRDYA